MNTNLSSEQIDALWSIGDPGAGLPKLQKALETNPSSADEIHTQICRCLGLQGRFDEGWAELAKVSAHPTEIVRIRVELESGRLKNSSGDRAGAVVHFQKALGLAAQTSYEFYAVDAAHMLGIATEGDDSVQWNERALAKAQASADARTRMWRGALLNNLGWTYHDSGDYEYALEKFEAAKTFREEVGEPVSIRIARWAVARCLRSLRRYEEALTILEDLARYPQAGYVSEELGENLLVLGRRAEAKAHFAKAYELLSKDRHLKEHEPARLQHLKELGA